MLVAPIRGFDFGELLGTMELSTSTTLNLQLHSARTGKFVAVSLPISILLVLTEQMVHPAERCFPLLIRVHMVPSVTI